MVKRKRTPPNWWPRRWGAYLDLGELTDRPEAILFPYWTKRGVRRALRCHHDECWIYHVRVLRFDRTWRHS